MAQTHQHALDPDDQELGDDIAPYVLAALNRHQFFELLEAQVFPEGDSGPRHCDHSYIQAESILTKLGFTDEEREDILIVCKSQGGFCDCEIMMNVDDREDSPRARYWRAKSAALESAS
jgi:hypothetical protein